jgi:hypothetical protein
VPEEVNLLIRHIHDAFYGAGETVIRLKMSYLTWQIVFYRLLHAFI